MSTSGQPRPAKPAKPRKKPVDRYHHGDLRDALLQLARRQLATVRPEDLSLRDLARTLNVSHNAPYKHFSTREALLAADGFARLAERTAAAGNLAEAGLAYVAFALEDPAVFRLMFTGALDKSDNAELLGASRASFVALRLKAGAGDDRAAVSAWAFVHGLATLLMEGQLPSLVALDGSPLETARRMLGAGRP
jgi:AcrR family transcriptional regulator